MLFNSWTFVWFALLTFCLYYLPLLRKNQVIVLIIASLVFYGWDSPALLLLLVFSIVMNSITSYQAVYSKEHGRHWAVVGVVLNLCTLACFKYANLLTFNLLSIPLPIGISFYTFEGISLLLDAYARKGENSSFVDSSLTRHTLKTSFFVAFFPHLISGPILKAHDFYPQIAEKQIQDIPWQKVYHYLIVGYFLKMVVADNLKDYTFWMAYPYYKTLDTFTGTVLLFGYSMQIFADFAGYSLIAIGLAAAFGYSLPANFNFPYLADSLTDFWRRWHISLSTWLRDYLYFPLGGSRKGKTRTYVNLTIVMVLGGLWHGAAWSYAVWGFYHGVGLAVERLFSRRRNLVIRSPFSILFVFVFITLGWLLFKFPRFDQAVDFLVTMSQNIHMAPKLGLVLPVLIFSIPVIVYHLTQLDALARFLAQDKLGLKGEHSFVLQSLALGLMIFAIIMNSGSSNGFIYFQF